MGHRSTLASLSSNWGQCLIVQTYLASGARPLLLLRPRAFLKRNERWPWTWLSPKKTPVPHTSVSDPVKKGWATHCLFILLSRNLTCFSCFVKQHFYVGLISGLQPCIQAEWQGRWKLIDMIGWIKCTCTLGVVQVTWCPWTLIYTLGLQRGVRS